MPRVVFVYQGTPDDGERYFASLDPDAVGIADLDKGLYEGFDVERGGMREMFGLGPWKRGIAAFLKGHRIGRKLGDPWTLPTFVAVDEGRVVWRFDGRHAGDHPDLTAIPGLIATASEVNR